MPLLAITVTPGGRVLDIFDHILMENEVNDLHRMEEADHKGHGPLRIRLSHLDEAVIQEIEHVLFSTERPVQERFFKARGVDFRKRDIELWPTEAQRCGGRGMSGVRVNERAETGVPGLYAAGDVASVPKQHLTGAFVFGEVAAEQAVEFIAKAGEVGLDEGQVRAAEAERARRHTTAGREIAVKDLEYKVRRFIGDYVIGLKNEYKLKRWLEVASLFRDDLRQRTLVRNGHELAKLYEVENIIRSATLSATAALTRKESRWGEAHRRTDFPERDDRNWLCHVTLRRGDAAEDILAGTAPLTKLAR